MSASPGLRSASKLVSALVLPRLCSVVGSSPRMTALAAISDLRYSGNCFSTHSMTGKPM